MTIYVFTGPTLPPSEAAKILEADYLPPAAIGDVYKAAQRRPWAIGIIDGFFESTPSVWHKEVLWAMAQGIRVFGASSMGALRAAELAAFGMVGVGAIFEAYRDGTIEDDDEVAVVHGPPELGYVQLSEAMVNIRATVRAAADADVVPASTAAALIDIAKSLFYKNRSYDRVLAAAAARQLPAGDLARLAAWLPRNQINQKRLDAVAMLQAIREARAAAPASEPVSYVFEHTTLWESVEQQYGMAGTQGAAGVLAAPRNGIFDELRLDSTLYEQLRRDATIRALARHEGQDAAPTLTELQEATRNFRMRMGFRCPAEIDAWMQARGLDRDGFLRLMSDDARRSRLHDAHAAAISAALADELCLTGAYQRLRERADEKHALLRARGVEQPTLEDAGMSEPDLLGWYLSQCGQEPGDGDPEDQATRLGFTNKEDLLRAALREYCYRAWKDP